VCVCAARQSCAIIINNNNNNNNSSQSYFLLEQWVSFPNSHGAAARAPYYSGLWVFSNV
jgi:hypothetical protein